MMNAHGLMVSAAYAATSAAIASVFNRTVPEPYMDEIFHIPQAQSYCRGQFTQWNDKITTLPGLYMISVGILNPLAQWTGHVFCDPLHLRAINVLFATVNLLILQKITTQIHGAKHFFDASKALLSSLNLALFPLLYFFNFMYYTDVGSTFMVLLMYCLHLDRLDWFASFIGVVAVLFRQTNIVWVAFVALQCVGPHLVHAAHDARINSLMAAGNTPVKWSLTTMGQLKELAEGLPLLMTTQPRKLAHLLWVVTTVAGGYVLVGIGFVAFVVLNEGVAVGDKSAHTVVFHPTQVAYFCGFAALFSAPFCVTRVVLFLHYGRKHWVITALALLLTAATVNGYSVAHPYLLADNRHYTFYVWRRILTPTDWSQMAAVPVYVFGGFCVLHSIRRTHIMFKLAFPLCVVLNLTPQLLLEFRYFVLPYLMYRLQVRPQTWWKLAAETALYAVINGVTIYMFLARPFKWSHDPEATQRFMW